MGDNEHVKNNDHIAINAWTVLDRAGQREFPLNDSSVLEIWGYTDAFSYYPGDEVRLKVHTTALHFDIVIFRDGFEQKKVYSKDNVVGIRQKTAEDAYETGCNWKDTHSFKVGKEWETGVYLILLKAKGNNGEAIEREAFFVVRSASPGKENNIAFVLSTATYTAYNDWGGANHYRRVENGIPLDLPAPLLALDRPMARGFLRLPVGAPRYSEYALQRPMEMPRYPWLEWAFAYEYSRHYPDTGWATYDGPFVRWAERQGYKFDFLTQYDLHNDPECLSSYNAVAIVGHDEYWSWQMRDAVDSHVANGGNLLRFAGNFLWQIRLENSGKTQVCYKMAADDPLSSGSKKHLTTTFWDAEIVGRSSAETMGLTGMGGVYARFGNCSPRSSGGLTVYRPEHWAFENTDLYYGDQFGGTPAAIVSFEVDGLDYTFRNGLPYPTYKDGAPKSLEIIAMTPTAGMYESDRHNQIVNAPSDEVMPLFNAVPASYEISEADLAYGSAMIGVCEYGKGSVFNAGCSEWVSGLIREDYFVEQITRNVLNRFS